MYSFEQLKKALRKRQEEKFEELKQEIRILHKKIEHVLERFFECTTSRAQTNHPELGIY